MNLKKLKLHPRDNPVYRWGYLNWSMIEHALSAHVSEANFSAISAALRAGTVPRMAPRPAGEEEVRPIVGMGKLTVRNMDDVRAHIAAFVQEERHAGLKFTEVELEISRGTLPCRLTPPHRAVSPSRRCGAHQATGWSRCASRCLCATELLCSGHPTNPQTAP